MRPQTFSCLLIALALGAISTASADQTERSAEVERLGFFVGQWNESGTMRGDPAAPMQPIEGAETCSWTAGGYAVICEEKTAGPGGGWEGVYILSYDSSAGQYQVVGVEKPGVNVHALGRIEGDRWVWLTDAAEDGSRARYTFAPAGPTSRTMKVEVGGGDEWLKIVDITYTAVE